VLLVDAAGRSLGALATLSARDAGSMVEAGIDLSGVPTGVYWLRVEDASLRGRLIVVR